MTTRYSRNALEMTASLVFAKSKATLIQDQAEPSAEPSEIAIHYTVNELWNQVEPSGTKRTCKNNALSALRIEAEPSAEPRESAVNSALNALRNQDQVRNPAKVL